MELTIWKLIRAVSLFAAVGLLLAAYWKQQKSLPARKYKTAEPMSISSNHMNSMCNETDDETVRLVQEEL